MVEETKIHLKQKLVCFEVIFVIGIIPGPSSFLKEMVSNRNLNDRIVSGKSRRNEMDQERFISCIKFPWGNFHWLCGCSDEVKSRTKKKKIY